MTEYYIANPTGNVTALVTTPVPVSEQPRKALEIMKREQQVEQVGFVSFEGKPSLRMAGGEFCGNASMSAAALFWYLQENSGRDLRAENAGPVPGKASCREESRKLELMVSGVQTPVRTQIRKIGEKIYEGSIELSGPFAVSDILLRAEDREIPAHKVEMPGITHLIVTEKLEDAPAERLIRRWCAELETPALGIMFTDFDKGSIRPLVYVQGAENVFWEHSCASGTAAAGVFLKERTGLTARFSFAEPGGTLSVVVDTARSGVRLCGTVILSEPKTV